MILTCNSCGKKFVVPDSAITASGRMVQCGSCGNKWKQFPEGEIQKNQSISRPKKSNSRPKPTQQKVQKQKKIKKPTTKKPREISLYSPEYLAKKHGIKSMTHNLKKKLIKKKKTKFLLDFIIRLIILIVFVIAFRVFYIFHKGFIISNIPASEYYLNYFFESIRNIFEIWKDLITY